MIMFQGVQIHSFVITIFLITTLSLVHSDDKLIQSACHDADSPAPCLQCVQSDPKAIKANRIEISTIVVSCLRKHATNIASNMSALAIRAKDDNDDDKKLMKSICESCTKSYHEAINDLNDATVKIKKGVYDDANVLLRKALENEFDCHTRVNGHKKLDFPKSVVDEMNVYEQLSDAALRIIDRL
ncbi:hypothetical protein ACFE04_024711 [Oxalis oulophora]